MENQQPETLETASQIELAITCGFIGSAEQYEHLLLSAVSHLRRLHARNQELEARLHKLQSDYEAVGAGGVSAQRIRQESDHIAQDLKMVAVQEPFGYFKAEPFGWRDCAETDEGAVALYEAPPPQADALDAVNLDRLGKALTKLGNATWVSQEEAAADIPRWVNALTSCVLEIPEAAPQTQAVNQEPFGYVTHYGRFVRQLKDIRADDRFNRFKWRAVFAAPQPQADARDAERWGSEPVTGTPFLQEEDQHLLDRFIETTEDNEGFDIGKEAIKRLANLGVVESLGFGRYGVTVFGYWVHEHYWYQNPSLPLKTNLDRDADSRAAIAAAKEI